MNPQLVMHDFFMPPTLKKLEGLLGILLSACLSVCVHLLTFEWCMLGI